MSDIAKTKIIQFSHLFLTFQTENPDTQINYLNDFALKTFDNLQYLYIQYLNQPRFFVGPVLQLRDN